MNIDQWVTTLQGQKPKAFINLTECSGIGDSINSTSAIRHFKQEHPNHILTLVVDDFYKNEVFANSPYIDFLVPAINSDIHWDKEDFSLYPKWSFCEQHQHPPENPHVCQSYNYHINGKYYPDFNMEMFQNNYDIKYVDEIVSLLPKDKPLAAISPAYTMFNRMLPQKDWQRIVNRLIKKYTVISFGGVSDFNLENVIDLRCKFRVNQIPYFLKCCEKIFTVNSGALHIAGCNPEIEIILLSVGEFPSSMVLPQRNGEVGWNCHVVEHICPIKEECFVGHTKETIYQEQLKIEILKYGSKYPISLLRKWAAWKYCAKKADQYSCSRLVMKNLMESGLLPE